MRWKKKKNLKTSVEYIIQKQWKIIVSVVKSIIKMKIQKNVRKNIHNRLMLLSNCAVSG